MAADDGGSDNASTSTAAARSAKELPSSPPKGRAHAVLVPGARLERREARPRLEKKKSKDQKRKKNASKIGKNRKFLDWRLYSLEYAY